VRSPAESRSNGGRGEGRKIERRDEKLLCFSPRVTIWFLAKPQGDRHNKVSITSSGYDLESTALRNTLLATRYMFKTHLLVDSNLKAY